MDAQQIRQHWANWAAQYGTDLRATTKTWTAKALELDSLARHLRPFLSGNAEARVLEVGCGNGINCVELAKQFPDARFDGVDFIDDMIARAVENGRISRVQDRVRFFVGDAVDIDRLSGLEPTYHAVFTDRCLINLNSLALQKACITSLAAKILPGGCLLMIENSARTYADQNYYRQVLGMEPRVPAAFNLFFDEQEIRPHLASVGLELTEVEDFSSLHDLMLYVLLPAINGGTIDYDHPLVQAATRLSIGLASDQPRMFGSVGQNRLFVCRQSNGFKPEVVDG
jgi:SAM-dependent methyltransferase